MAVVDFVSKATNGGSHNFGQNRGDHIHGGNDFGVPVGTNVQAVVGGTVITAVNDGGYHGGAGNYVTVKDSQGNTYKYMHNSKVLVNVGDTVTAGSVLALSGNTGRSTGPHVHFEVADSSGKKIDSWGIAHMDLSNLQTVSGVGITSGDGTTTTTGTASEIISKVILFIAILLLCIAAFYLFFKAFGGSVTDLIPQTRAVKEIGKEVLNNGNE